MTISRRNLLALGSVGLLGSKLTGGNHETPRSTQTSSNVKILDIQVASIQDDYICHLVKVTTNTGIYGLGEARPKKTKIPGLIKKYKEVLIGEDPLRVNYLVSKMISSGHKEMGAISGIETALWDLAGKLLETPCYNLLGGKFRDKVRVYYDLSPANTPKTTNPGEWVACALRAIKAGFREMKIDINRSGGDVPEWIKILKAMRDSVGSDIKIGVDFHWQLTAEQTDQFIKLAEPLDLWFVEDPMRYQKYYKDYQRIVAEAKIPIMALEQMTTRKQFHNWIEKKICNIIQPDGQYCGGLMELKRAADLGELYGMKTLCHNMCTPVGTFAQAHACATIKDFISMENACADKVIKHNGPLYKDGYLLLNDKPGFGIELDEDYCRKHLAEGSKFFS
jgi:L-alanine-DL-glutamate epimerase-like enolase superfamily enzyme